MALTLLENNFLKLATVIALTAKSYETLLLSAPKNNVAGGSKSRGIKPDKEKGRVSAEDIGV